MSVTRAELLEHSAWMRRLAGDLAPDPNTAEDLVQDTWVAALGRTRSPLRQPRPWLARVLRNQWRQRRRREGRRTERELAAAAPVVGEHDFEAEVLTRRVVADAVWELPAEQQVTVLMRYYRGLEPREISGVLGVPVKTVNSRLYRAHAALRKRLDREWGGREAWVPLVALVGRSGGRVARLWMLRAVLAAGVLVAGAAVALRVPSASPVAAGDVARAGDRAAPAPRGEPAARVGTADPVAPIPAAAPSRRAPTSTARPRVPEPAEPEAGEALEGWVEGRVVDLAGRGVGGAVVSARTFDLDPIDAGIRIGARLTDAGGRALETTSGEGGHFRVRVQSGVVRADGAEDVALFGSLVRPTERPAAARVLATAPRAAVHGSVVDASGNALAAVAVVWEAPEGLAPPDGAVEPVLVEHATVTDEAGQFRLDVPGVDGSRLAARLAGFRTGRASVSGGGAVRLVLEGVRPAPTTVGGRVRELDGSPVADAYVSFGRTPVRTDAAGEFTLSGEAGDSLWVAVPGRGGLEVSQPLSGWPAFVELALPDRVRSITGVVLDRDGEPVPGALVWPDELTPVSGGPIPLLLEVLVAGGDYWLYAETDAEGRFTVEGLLDREYRLRVLDVGTFVEARTAPASPGDDLVVSLGERPLGRVSGRVVSRAGEPLPGLSVHLFRRVVQGGVDLSLGGPAMRTDAAGRFEHGGVATEGVELYVTGDDVIPRPVPLPSAAGELDITVSRACRVRVELPADDEVLWFSMRDARGDVLELVAEVDGTVQSSDRASIRGGTSRVVVVPEEASELVVERRGEVVVRRLVALRPGELNVIRP